MAGLGFVIGTGCPLASRQRRLTCSARPQRAQWRASANGNGSGRPRAHAGILAALAVAAGSLLGGAVPRAQAAAAESERPAATKEVRYDGRAELDGTEKALSLALTGGAFAALSVWAWRRNREDDELEQIRIREEVERLEKLKAEFMNVEEDDDSIDDEDLYKELSKRLEQEADGSAEGGDEASDEENKDSTTEPTNGTTEKAEGDESLDMLRRMWDATDDDTKKPPAGDGKNKA